MPTRGIFGGSTDDFAYSNTVEGYVQIRPVPVTFWSAKTGGTQYDNLIHPTGSGTVVSIVPASPLTGTIPQFEGPPDSTVRGMWMDAGAERVLIYALATIVEETIATRDLVSSIVSGAGSMGWGLDTDGVPYYDPVTVSDPDVVWLFDTDGVPYFTALATP